MLPAALVDFIGKGDRLFDRVVQFDKLERGKMPDSVDNGTNGVADQNTRLQAAFAPRR
jgi:regulator of CtrA degradation